MSRISNRKSVAEIIEDYLTGQMVRTSKGMMPIRKEDAKRFSDELTELLPRSSGPKSWLGYALDRSTVLFSGISKSEVKSKWQASIGAEASEVRTVYSNLGIYRYSFTAPDLSSHDIWVVQAGAEGFGLEAPDA